MDKLKRKIAVPNFVNEGKHLYEDELGWSAADREEARSDASKNIFEHFIVEVGLNLGFYYIDNDTFYGIHTERIPIEVKILPRDTTKSYLYAQCKCDTHVDGEILYSFDNAEEIWDTVRIDGRTLEEVLNRSVILTMD